MKLDNNLYDNGLREGRDVIVLTSKKGNVNSYHFFIWARDIYIPFVKKQRRDNNLRATERATLIMDGYGAHVMDEVSNLFKKNCIDVFLLPAHSSHGFQPLDLTVFHSMKARVKSMATGFEKHTQAHQVQRAVMALQMATNFFSNIAAFRKAGIIQDCSVKPARAKIDEP
ncbi:MAG: hypothetical protein EZS28_050119, partial [Streblomastix strix]